MNAELKTKWLEALRGGEYKQGDGFLRTDAGFCCLGVLCDIVKPVWKKGGGLGIEHDCGELDYPTESLLQEVGLDFLASRRVAEMNDSGSTFAEIADWIEANVPVDA